MAQQRTEDEPLLGRPGDVAQGDEWIGKNVVTGTAVVAQGGIWLLAAIVWTAIFTHDLILFSAHPLLNSAGLIFLVQAILLLQPTHTPSQKRTGTAYHFALNLLGLALLLAGLVVIEYNKISHAGAHFESAHARLGLAAYILFLAQAAVGFTQYYTPALYGGVDKAKKVWKWHRGSGYAVVLLALAAVCASVTTGYNVSTLGMRMWSVVLASVLVVAGLGARIKKQKFGFA